MLMVMETVRERNRNFLHYIFNSGFGFSSFFFFFFPFVAVPSPEDYLQGFIRQCAFFHLSHFYRTFFQKNKQQQQQQQQYNTNNSSKNIYVFSSKHLQGKKERIEKKGKVCKYGGSSSITLYFKLDFFILCKHQDFYLSQRMCIKVILIPNRLLLGLGR